MLWCKTLWHVAFQSSGQIQFLDTTLQYNCPLLCMHMFKIFSCINFKTIKDWMRGNTGHTYAPIYLTTILLLMNNIDSWKFEQLIVTVHV